MVLALVGNALLCWRRSTMAVDAGGSEKSRLFASGASPAVAIILSSDVMVVSCILEISWNDERAESQSAGGRKQTLIYPGLYLL